MDKPVENSGSADQEVPTYDQAAKTLQEGLGGSVVGEYRQAPDGGVVNLRTGEWFAKIPSPQEIETAHQDKST